MAMNNSNYGYSPSGYPSLYSSTPTGIRTQRPRFGYSGPTLYPRPRSSASKPNPDSFSDSMINNYGTSTSRIDTSFSSENGNSYNDSYSSSNYYTANESFYSPNQSRGDASMIRDNSVMYNGPNTASIIRDNSVMYDGPNTASMIRDNSVMYDGPNTMCSNPSMVRGDRSLVDRSLCGDMQNSGILSKPNSQFGPPKYLYNSTVSMNNTEYKGNFQKNSTFGFSDKNSKPPFTRKFGKAKRMATKQAAWRCELCSLDFTSQIPYDMHMRGARHAKKLKAKQALSAVQLQAVTVPDGEKGFFCELCNVKANSSLQLQTHLEGSKHKSKLQPKEPKDDGSNENIKTEVDASVNGKTNGSLTRSLPADFGEPQPSKLAKFACDVCNISVNSEIQLQQHLSSKKHQNKVEGKPVIKGKKIKLENETTSEADVTDTVVANTELEPASSETSTKVVGVKTLASSFVQGGTLQ